MRNAGGPAPPSAQKNLAGSLFNRYALSYCTLYGRVRSAFQSKNRHNVGAATFAAGLQNPFFHCFIESGKEPRYKFIDGTGPSITFNDTSKGFIADGVSKWVKAAQLKKEKNQSGVRSFDIKILFIP